MKMLHKDVARYTCPVSLGGGYIRPCLGKQCAAWRWNTSNELERRLVIAIQKKADDPEPSVRPYNVGPDWKWEPGCVDTDGEDYPGSWEEPMEEVWDRAAGVCGMTTELPRS